MKQYSTKLPNCTKKSFPKEVTMSDPNNPNKKIKQTKNRKRNIISLNPPYSKNVVTKVGHYFLKLLDKHFPRHHKLHKIFNRNTVKVSYSCIKKTQNQSSTAIIKRFYIKIDHVQTNESATAKGKSFVH